MKKNKRASLSQSTIEKLDHYVYLLIDPRDKKIFYVGMGKGNRIYNHMESAMKTGKPASDKDKKIIEIKNSGNEIVYKILRHGLTKKEHEEVESAVIDLIGVDNLTNIVHGHKSEDRGIMKLDDIKIKYEAEKLKPEEPIVLININNLYRREMTKSEIYEATRKSWRINVKRVSKIRIACTMYRGIIREVFEVKEWVNSPEVEGKYMFNGKIATNKIRKKYLNRSVSEYIPRGTRYPIKYIEKII